MSSSKAEVTPSIIRDLIKRYPGAVQCNVLLSELSRWKIGGAARVMVSPRNVEELACLRAWIYEKELPSVVIGATSNLLFSDKGLNAVCIRLGTAFAPLNIRGNRVTAGSGVWVPGLARKAMSSGLTGLEHTCGIPGTLGGLVYMNGGSQRKGIGDSIKKVESINEKGEIIYRDKEACGFGYRSSLFQDIDEVVSNVEMELCFSECKQRVRKEMLGILSERRRKFPQKVPNCGSVFVSDPAMYTRYGPPGKVIETCGLKGLKKGGAQVSDCHANFIVNNGNATAEDVRYLIKFVRDEVYRKTGYLMKVEPRFVKRNGKIVEVCS